MTGQKGTLGDNLPLRGVPRAVGAGRGVHPPVRSAHFPLLPRASDWGKGDFSFT